jgi:alpha-methylacyl-CoA racemase
MTEGAALLASMTWTLLAMGKWSDERGTNLLDSGAPFYDSYETADEKYLSVGAVEPKFYDQFRRQVGLADDNDFDAQMDTSRWSKQRETLTALFRTKTRDEWIAAFEAHDVCCAPVLSMHEAPGHPHNVVRGTFIQINGVTQPAPAPRYSKTKVDMPCMRTWNARGAAALLRSVGYRAEDLAKLQLDGVIEL